MSKTRYTGPAASVDVALPGCQITCKRNVWVDLTAACVAAGVPAFHAAIWLAGMDPAVWETETAKPKTATLADKETKT